LNFKNPKDAEEAGIAVIHQELTLFEELSIIENIYMGSQKVKGLVIDWNSMYEESQILLKN
jgi:ABC-type sugar transport system, ATPase component